MKNLSSTSTRLARAARESFRQRPRLTARVRHGEAPSRPDHVPEAAGHLCASSTLERACEMHVPSPPSPDPPMSRALQRLAACAKSATASAPSATPTCGRASSCVSATSATTAPIRVAASSVASRASPMPTTARSARSRRRTYVAPRAHTRTRTHPPSYTSPAALTYCLRARERVCAAAARWLSKDRQPGLVEDRPLLRAQKVRLPQEVTAVGAGARTASAPPLEVERVQRRAAGLAQ